MLPRLELCLWRNMLIAKGADGNIIEAFAVYHVGTVHPAIAEIMSTKEALSWTKQRNWKDATIETDSLLATQALSSSLHMPSAFGLLVNNCRRLLDTLKNVRIYYVPGSGSGAAHCLARGSHSWSGCHFTVRNAPTSLQSIAMADLAI